MHPRAPVKAQDSSGDGHSDSCNPSWLQPKGLRITGGLRASAGSWNSPKLKKKKTRLGLREAINSCYLPCCHSDFHIHVSLTTKMFFLLLFDSTLYHTVSLLLFYSWFRGYFLVCYGPRLTNSHFEAYFPENQFVQSSSGCSDSRQSCTSS